MGNRLSAGVVVIRFDEAHPEFLMLRAFRHWDFPKGLVEPGEEPMAAAIREVAEETTIGDLEFRWGKLFRETEPYNRGKVARYYLAATRQVRVELPINPQLGRPEHHEYRWANFSQALQLGSPRIRPVILWAANVLNLRAGEED